MRNILAITILSMLFILAACGNNNNDSVNNQSENDSNNEQTENNLDNDEAKEFYHAGETATIESEIYGYSYEVTVNDYEITNNSESYPMDDFYGDYKEGDNDRFLLVSNVTINNTSEEHFTPSKHIPMHVTEEGNESGEIVDLEKGFTEALEDVEPGESITGDMIATLQMTDNNPAKNYWLKFETLTDSETIWELPNTVK